MNQERNYGIDLLKIISMMMVIILHILGQGGILKSASRLSLQYELVWLLKIACYCAVNCYALVSGYVMYDKKMNYHRVIYLWLQTLFYTVVITVLFSMFFPGTTGIKDIVHALFPISTSQYWYMTAYFGMVLFIPLLNHVINTMRKKDLLISIISILFFLTISPIILIFDPFKLNSGYSMIWLILMYLIGGYISKYSLPIKLKNSIILYIVAIVLTWFSKFVIEMMPLELSISNLYINYTSITIVIASIALLLFFSKINIHKTFYKNIIKTMSSLSLGVYLIHTHPKVFQYIFKDLFVGLLKYSSFILVASVIAIAIMIYIMCTLIDEIRVLLFKILKINRLCVFIVDKINDLYKYIYPSVLRIIYYLNRS